MKRWIEKRKSIGLSEATEILDTLAIDDGISKGSFDIKFDESGKSFIEGSIEMKVRTGKRITKDELQNAYQMFLKALQVEQAPGKAYSENEGGAE